MADLHINPVDRTKSSFKVFLAKIYSHVWFSDIISEKHYSPRTQLGNMFEFSYYKQKQKINMTDLSEN